MSRPKDGEFTPKQIAILNFLHGYLTEFGHSPGRSDFEDNLDVGVMPSITSALRMLQIRGCLYGENRPSLSGTAYAVFWVDHPIFGHAEIDALSSGYLSLSVDPFAPFSPLSADRRKRKCMCCRNEFVSEHKFNRLCAECSIYAAQMLGSAAGDYMSNGLAIMSGRIGGFRSPGP